MTEPSPRRSGPRVERGQKRVRALLGGEVVADTRRPVLVWERPYYPTYYLPAEDVLADLRDSQAQDHDVHVAGQSAPGAARLARLNVDGQPCDLVRLDWAAMDEWLEEDEPVYTHPRDPGVRVDILASSRHVVVEVDGTRLLDSRRPTVLFETGLPPRFYVPLTDVRLDVLAPSATVTHCPYKGAATYWSVVVDGVVHRDLVWTYRAPLPESQKIARLVTVYTERVDLWLDGELQERPRTHFA